MAAVAQVAPADPLAAARSALADGSSDELELSLHAKALLEAGDLATLGARLADDEPRVARAILAALGSTETVGLVDEILVLAGGSTSEPLRRVAQDNLRRMAQADGDMRARLTRTLEDGAASDAGLAVIVAVLGSSRDLSAVPALLAQLDGPRAEDADRALAELTALDPGPRGERAAWEAAWERHAGFSRERLLELALARLREAVGVARGAADAELAALRLEAEEARIERMGHKDVVLLSAALADGFARVRLAAAQRLAAHAAPELAAAALPALLARLGQAPASGTHGAPVQDEQEPEVRAAVVQAVGELGRSRPEVLPVLLAELAGPHLEVARVAVAALDKVRGRPSVVRPLLDHLERATPDEATRILALTIIAANRPAGVVAELERHLTGATSPAVAAAAASALVACEELDTTLDLVEALAGPLHPADLRFSLARSAGGRVRDAALTAAQRARLLSLLASLAGDADPSVRAEALSALGKSGAPEALPLLMERAQLESDASVQERVVRALGDLRLVDGLPVIGRLVAQRAPPDPLWEQGRKALVELGSGFGPAQWWSAARSLAELGADELALVALAELSEPTTPGPVADPELQDRGLGLMAELLVATGRHEQAHDLLLGLHERMAPWPPIDLRLALLASTSEARGLFEEAADHHEALTRLLPADDARLAETRRKLAGALWRAGLHARALTEVQQLHAADPEDNTVMFWLGDVYMALGQDGRAEDIFRRLLPRVPAEGDDLRARVEAALEALAAPEGEPGGAGAGASSSGSGAGG